MFVLFNMFCSFLQGDANSVQVSIQLKLNEKVKNSFAYCEVHLPFFHRFVMFPWFKTMVIDQFRYIKIQPKTIDLSTRLRGITTERSIVFGWVLIDRNWPIVCSVWSQRCFSLSSLVYTTFKVGSSLSLSLSRAYFSAVVAKTPDFITDDCC